MAITEITAIIGKPRTRGDDPILAGSLDCPVM